MRLAVSNIAWQAPDDEAAYAMLKDLGVTLLEIAPPRFWPDLTKVTEAEARAKSEALAAKGLTVCSFQALLFGRADLQLFQGRELIEFTKQVCTLASWMGARTLVFGSPKNRLRGELSPDEAFKKAVAPFREIGDHAAASGVVLCLEPNPTGYGGDFLTNAPWAASLVRAVDSPGIAMNFDMGEVIMNGEDAGALVRELLPVSAHFHVSEPMLEPFVAQRSEHRKAAQALRAASYDGIVSVEMKTPRGGLEVVRSSIEAVRSVYLG